MDFRRHGISATLDGEGRCDIDRRDDAVHDEKLTEERSRQLLLLEPVLELVSVDEISLDEKLAQGSPIGLGHALVIGAGACRLKT